MREFPVFVPVGPERVAAVVTVPGGDPRGLVVLLTGVGAGRSHRFGLWTRTARRLASRGLAAVRMEYLGVGDSTGEVPRWRRSDQGAQLAQARAVSRVALRGVGLDRFAVAGNCFGALVSLDLMAVEPACAAAACLMPLIPEGGVGGTDPPAWRGRLHRALRTSALARRMILPRARSLAGRLDRHLGSSVATALERGPVLVAYGEEDAGFARGVRASLDRALSATAVDRRRDLEFVVLPEAMHQFRSRQAQEAAIRAIERFMVDVFGSA
jgi:dienelactone hydrolase